MAHQVRRSESTVSAGTTAGASPQLEKQRSVWDQLETTQGHGDPLG